MQDLDLIIPARNSPFYFPKCSMRNKAFYNGFDKLTFCDCSLSIYINVLPKKIHFLQIPIGSFWWYSFFLLSVEILIKDHLFWQICFSVIFFSKFKVTLFACFWQCPMSGQFQDSVSPALTQLEPRGQYTTIPPLLLTLLITGLLVKHILLQIPHV